MTRATAPVAAEIMAGRPPVKDMVTAIVNAANNPIRGSTPAMIENAIASGISAVATTRPAMTSLLSRRGDFRVRRTDCSFSGVRTGCVPAVVVAERVIPFRIVVEDVEDIVNGLDEGKGRGVFGCLTRASESVVIASM